VPAGPWTPWLRVRWWRWRLPCRSHPEVLPEVEVKRSACGSHRVQIGRSVLSLRVRKNTAPDRDSLRTRYAGRSRGAGAC
jgi:hypothetical protein